VSTVAPLHRPKTVLDLLRIPLLGRVLKSRNGRLWLQIPLLLVSLLLIYDGFSGSSRANENLATVVPWVHYRGIVVIALLLLGNLFCMGCPFTLPRTLARRFVQPGRRFPKRLRNKGLAIAALLVLFFLYEWLNLWSSPLLTAWVIVAYFGLSFVIEAFFDESAFCKYICPLGTFNFVYSTASPTQIGARNPDTCRTCVGHECVNGSFSMQPVIRLDEIKGGEATIVHDRNGVLGCPTELFVPQIKSNLDCTQCLDCARACPHDNVALFVRTPGRELIQSDAWPKRWDLILLISSLAFLGLVNAFGMIPPVYDLIRSIAGVLSVSGSTVPAWAEAVALLLIFGVGGVILPLVAVSGAAALSRTITRTARKFSLRDTAAAFAPALVPIGFAIWIGHYGFHFLTGGLTIIPALQTFFIERGIGWLGTAPDWSLVGITDLNLIGALQVVILLGGFGWSLMIAERVSRRLYRRDSMPGLLPWALLFLALMLLTIAVFSQPMEMRGTILFD
jgi:ferredoxin